MLTNKTVKIGLLLVFVALHLLVSFARAHANSQCQLPNETVATGTATIDAIAQDWYSESVYNADLYVNSDQLIHLVGLTQVQAQALGQNIGQPITYSVVVGELSTTCQDYYTNQFTIKIDGVTLVSQ